MSPYQSFVFIEREPLKAVADHNTRFSLIIPGIQRDSSIISASPPLCTKFSEEPQFSGRHPQSMRFSESSVPQATLTSGKWFAVLSHFFYEAYQSDIMNFSNCVPLSGRNLTTDLVDYCISEAENKNILELKNYPNTLSNNCSEPTYN